MTITNHVLTGAIITKFLPLPIALPLAFISHFVLDSLPHFGLTDEDIMAIRNKHKKLLYSVLTIDCLCAAALCIWFMVAGHISWLISGLIAFSPDIVWIYRFIFPEKLGSLAPPKYKNNAFIRFHIAIQKYQSIEGLMVDIVYAGLAFYILISA